MLWVDEFERLLHKGAAPGLTIGVADGAAKIYLGFPSPSDAPASQDHPAHDDAIMRTRLQAVPLAGSERLDVTR